MNETARTIDELKGAADRLLELLSDGQWHGQEDLVRVAGYRYGARLFDLRKRGHRVERQRLGTRRHFYRLITDGRLL